MAPETCRETGHRGRCAAQAPGDLAMCTSGNQPGGHGQQQLGTLQVVRAGKGLQGEAASAGGTEEAGNTSSGVGLSTVGAASGAAVALRRAMVRALGPGAMRGSKTVDSPAFHRLARNTHAGVRRARAVPESEGSVYGVSDRFRNRPDRMRTHSHGQVTAGAQQLTHHLG